MAKDYLKFRNAIKKDTHLNLEESYMLEILFDYYNISYGYAFPSYEVLMQDLKTKRRAKISKLTFWVLFYLNGFNTMLYIYKFYTLY